MLFQEVSHGRKRGNRGSVGVRRIAAGASHLERWVRALRISEPAALKI